MAVKTQCQRYYYIAGYFQILSVLFKLSKDAENLNLIIVCSVNKIHNISEKIRSQISQNEPESVLVFLYVNKVNNIILYLPLRPFALKCIFSQAYASRKIKKFISVTLRVTF